MAAASEPTLHLEVAHVLYIDVVGYSKLLINDQSEILARRSPAFEAPAVSGGVKIDLQKGALNGWCPCPQRRGFRARRRTFDHKVR